MPIFFVIHVVDHNQSFHREETLVGQLGFTTLNYSANREFRQYLGKRSNIIIFGTLLTTFEGSCIKGSWGSSNIWLVPIIKPPNQVNLN